MLAIALIVLGPERLPEVLRTVGKVMRELRAASNTVMRELSGVLEDEPPRADAGTPTLEDPARATRPAAAQPFVSSPSAAAAPAAGTAASKTDPPEHQPS